MVVRFVNTCILILIILLMLSGAYGIVWVFPGWMYEVHRVAGWALMALIPWKVLISMRSLKRGLRPSYDRGVVPVVSIILSAAILLVVALGLMWAWRLGSVTLWLGYTVISWHWILALALMPPFVLHSLARWPRPKREEFLSRQGFIKLAGLTVVALAGWGASKFLAGVRADPAAPRAATGSRLDGYLSANKFPVTNSAGDGQTPIDLSNWRLRVSGDLKTPLALAYEEVLNLSSESLVAALDCTIGWYSIQRWKGIRLQTLIELAYPDMEIQMVKFRSSEGYEHSLPIAEAREVLLATHVGGQALGHLHGLPLRAVVPSRRGWFWVKWLSEIQLGSTAPTPLPKILASRL